METGQTHQGGMTGQLDINFTASGNQDNLVSRKGPHQFKAAKQMAHAPNVLAIKNDFHRFQFNFKTIMVFLVSS
jgi:hypothetical protein